eukprot:IDg22695t1
MKVAQSFCFSKHLLDLLDRHVRARKSETPKVPFQAMWQPGKLQISTRTLTLAQQGHLRDLNNVH